jgi:pimeloyl-ACP methyl ester carboxylesterase
MRPRVAREIVDFAARDGFSLNLHHYSLPAAPKAEPVIVLHGAGVRAGIFLPPAEVTFVDALVDAGFDVWLLNWRASIDLPPNEWTLETAAVHDFAPAVQTVLDRTGHKKLKAVIHCQGSTSFMMSAVAGLLPEVTTIISNAVALHPVVPPLARLKSRYATNTVGRFMKYLNPQWGLSAPHGWPTVIDWWVRSTHHECNNAVCKHSSFTFGAGFPTLWRHENLDDATHEWLKGEFAHVPMTFFREMAQCIEAGHLISSGKYSELPASFVGQAPKTEARFVFLGGEFNDCFMPESQARTFDFFDRYAPGRHTFYELAGYGHLDVFVGKNAARDTFPLIIDELRKA